MKKFIRRLLRRRGWELHWVGYEVDADSAIQAFEQGGRVPWTTGYREAKFRFLKDILQDPIILELFHKGRDLPANFGVGFDERCVEYPWVFAQITKSDRRILDAGSTFNFPEIISQPILAGRQLHILTLAPEEHCFWKQGVSYVFADLRELPYRDAFFDLVVCISTLEHVGMDNSLYGAATSPCLSSDSHWQALEELYRVVKPNGKILISVPFGRAENHGFFQQFDSGFIQRLNGQYPEVETSFFRYSPSGWRRASLEECHDAIYSRAALQRALKPDFKWPQTERQAGAGAVACFVIQRRG